ncbi:early endosome antigen 1-like [Ptychodera flava]|uniref:early endosome antigen 1-like n=1 Tax=Ptychodera flava TaxID=63121 RepID=UPI00396A5144
MFSQERDEPNNLACLAEMKELIAQLQTVSINCGLHCASAEDTLEEINSIVEKSSPLLELIKNISSELASTIEELAEVMSEAIDNAGVNLQQENSEQTEYATAREKKEEYSQGITSDGNIERRRHRKSSQTHQTSVSPYEKLFQSAKNLSSLISAAFSLATKVKMTSEVMTKLSDDISTNVNKAKKKSDRLYDDARKVNEKAIDVIKELRYKRQNAEKLVLSVQETSSQCDSCDDEKLASMLKEAEESCKALEKTIRETEDFSLKLDNGVRENEKFLNDEYLFCQKIVLQKKVQSLDTLMNEAVIKSQSLLSAIQHTRDRKTRLRKARLSLDKYDLCQVLSDAKQTLNQTEKEASAAMKLHEALVDTSSNLSIYHPGMSTEDKLSEIENLTSTAEEALTIVSRSKETVERLVTDTENILQKRDGFSEQTDTLKREIDNCCHHTTRGAKMVKEVQVCFRRFVKSDPNRKRGKRLLKTAETLADEVKTNYLTLRQAVDGLSKKSKSRSGNINIKRVDTVKRVIQSSEAFEKTLTDVAEDFRGVVVNPMALVNNASISKIQTMIDEAKDTIEHCRKTMNQLDEADPDNWPLLSLPNPPNSLIVLQLQGCDLDRLRSRIAATVNNSKQVSTPPVDENQRLISQVMELKLNGASKPVQLTHPGFLNIRYVCNWNPYAGDIIVKEYLGSSWQEKRLLDPLKTFEQHQDKTFVQVGCQDLQPTSSFAVLHQSKEVTCTVDRAGARITIPGRGCITFDIPGEVLSESNTVTAKTFFPEDKSLPKLLSANFPLLLRLLFSRRPRQPVKYTLETPKLQPLEQDPYGRSRLLLMERKDESVWSVVAEVADEDARSLDRNEFEMKDRRLFRQVDYALIRDSSGVCVEDINIQLREAERTRRETIDVNSRIFDACFSEIALYDLAKQIGTNYYELGIRLNLSQAKLETIKVNNPNNVVEQAFKTLLHWQQNHLGRKEPKTMFVDLHGKLMDVDRRDLADWLSDRMEDAEKNIL